VRTKVILEKDIEAKVVKYAKELGCLVRKLSGLGFAAWPDRLFILPNGRHVYIEFKRPGGKLSPGQSAMVDDLARRGIEVFVVDDVEDGKGIIAERMNG